MQLIYNNQQSSDGTIQFEIADGTERNLEND